MIRTYTALAILVASTATSSCTPGEARLDTDDQKASYAIGHDMGNQMIPAANLLDVEAFMKGFRDALSEAEPALDPAEIQPILMGFSDRVREEQNRMREADATRNLEEGEAYLAENGAREGVTTTESGLQYEVLQEGSGERPGPTDQVTLHYKGTLIDGTQFDSSYDRGSPATFPVGGVIPGFSEGLQLMPVGSHYRFVIPGDLGYGAQGSGRNIGPNATLVFEVELLEIAGSE